MGLNKNKPDMPTKKEKIFAVIFFAILITLFFSAIVNAFITLTEEELLKLGFAALMIFVIPLGVCAGIYTFIILGHWLANL